jgi:hypothetical protein
MIISDEVEKFDESTRVIMFDKDEKGECVPKKTGLVLSSNSTFNLGEEYYKTRHNELMRLKEDLLNKKISPVKLFIDYFLMDAKDVASRVQIPFSKLKKFSTYEGFKNIDVKTLIKFAELFDIGVADFFQMIYVDKISKIDSKNLHDRTLQELKIK